MGRGEARRIALAVVVVVEREAALLVLQRRVRAVVHQQLQVQQREWKRTGKTAPVGLTCIRLAGRGWAAPEL